MKGGYCAHSKRRWETLLPAGSLESLHFGHCYTGWGTPAAATLWHRFPPPLWGGQPQDPSTLEQPWWELGPLHQKGGLQAQGWADPAPPFVGWRLMPGWAKPQAPWLLGPSRSIVSYFCALGGRVNEEVGCAVLSKTGKSRERKKHPGPDKDSPRGCWLKPHCLLIPARITLLTPCPLAVWPTAGALTPLPLLPTYMQN